MSGKGLHARCQWQVSQEVLGGLLCPGTSGCRPTVARFVTPEEESSFIFGHEACYWRVGDNPPDNGSQGAGSPLAPSCETAAYISPTLHPGAVPLGMMVAVGVLGLLLCLRLCRGTWELRLVNGGVRCAGRVEVKHEGEWGSICVSDFNWESRWDAVVCKSLGCGPAVHSSVYAPFGQGTGRIWLHIFCQGNEELLQDCIHLGWGNHYCDHDTDVGVTCEDALELRLADGGGPCAGRVEVKLRGHWGTVGDENWNMDNAEVVCQQLGCGSAAGAYTASTLFGKGTGSISLARVDCQGNETALWYCKIYGWGPYRGIHDYDTAVICQGFSRLVGSDMACAGRLEVRKGRTWTRVCEGDVDIKAAQVVCRELGCGPALAVPGAGWFEAGRGPFWQGGFKCTGTEPLLSACAWQLPRSESCTGHATIICSSYTGFRLAGNSSSCAGRVEVEAGGSWGSLCASDWDVFNAHVFCHHLGCGPAVTVPPGGYFGGEDGLLRRDTFSCSGSEHHPGQCPTVVLGQPACLPGHAAAVNCSGVAEPLRLVEGESRCDGRLEVATSLGAWARVPVGLWDARSASVVCRQLGCGVPEKVYTVPGSSPAALQGLWCAGTEHSLAQCNVSGMAAAPTGSPEEVAVICSGSRRVMLVGSTGRCAGRVEVYVNGTWGSVCQDTWDLSDATVVCRQLGCGTALEAPRLARFGPGTGPLWLNAGGCAGTEASLWDCPAMALRVCRRGGGAGAVCSEHLSLRLMGGSGRCSGHLEVLHNGTWGRVCANGTSAATATIACRQLGCGDGGTLMDAPIWDPAPAWLSWVACEEGSHLLWQCPSAPWHLHACSPSGDAYVTCHQDSNDISGTPTPSPGVPSSKAPLPATGTVSVPTVLCVVLGTLLFLTLGVLAMQVCRAQAWCQGPCRASDAISDAVYEELDYTLPPEYQEVPSCSGSPLEGSEMKLPYDSWDSVEESDTKTAPDSPAQHDPPHYYDNATAASEGSPSASTEDVSEGSWGCGPPRGGSCPPPSAQAAKDPHAQSPEGDDTGYDDVDISTLGTSL